MRIALAWTMSAAVFVAASSVQAADQQVVGTIRKVDAAEGSITLTTKVGDKERDLTLAVVKKTKVTVDGQPAELKDVRKGQHATIVFDSDLEVATKVDVTGEGVAEAEVTTLDELPPDAFNSAPWLSPDGLTLYFVSYAEGEKQGWIWSGRRKDKDSLFEDFKRLVPGSDPAVTEDGLELILNDQNVFRSATRKSVDEAFGRPRAIRELEAAGLLAGPSLTADGLALYADRWAKGTTDFLKGNDLVRFQRATRTSKWGPAEVVEIAGLPEGASRKLRFLSVSKDQQRGLVMLRTEDRANRVLVLSRKKAADPFKVTAMVSLAGDSAFAQFPRWVEATGELFCMKADESKNPRMVVIRNFDFDAATVPVDLDDLSAAAGGGGAGDQQALQGEWLAVGEGSAGKALPRDEVKRRKRLVVIEGNSFTMTRTIDGMLGKYEGTFEINAGRGHFDWRGTGPRGASIGLTGIYSLEGDTLKLCYRHSENGGTRPTEFKSDQEGAIFLTLKRQSK